MQNIFWSMIFVSLCIFCTPPNRPAAAEELPPEITPEPEPAAWNLPDYLPQLEGLRVGLVVNQTSRIGETHLVDTLLKRGVQVRKVFAPEHGFRGEAADGEEVADGRDVSTGLPIVSLYGKKKKPDPKDLEGLEMILFDIQDVGTRFYTYISTLHLVMEACAEADIPLMVLDRPNPNGHFIDGPLREPAQASFVGMHPIPVVHGLTVGELARMINGEGWLKGGLKGALRVIPCRNYTHHTAYALPVRPSPNLPNMRAVYLYPTLCFFEGTTFSVGRGTEAPFQQLGHPHFPKGDHIFVPQPNAGSRYPKHEGDTCRGYSFLALSPDSLRARPGIDLDLLLETYEAFPDQDNFFRKDGYFDLLAGTESLRKQIITGATAAEIRQSWEADLRTFRQLREQYLLYPD